MAVNTSLNKAVDQIVNLGIGLLGERMSVHSKLNQLHDSAARRELENLYYNEIVATARVIRLFTGREISFQWCKGADGEDWGGFSLYEILEDAPREEIPAGVTDTYIDRYTGKSEKINRVYWREAEKQGKLVKIYQLVFDKNANPCYVGGYLIPEFQVVSV